MELGHNRGRVINISRRRTPVYAQLGQHPPRRASETSPKRSSGTLSCLSARPPDLADLADAAGTRPRVVAVFLSYVPFLYCKLAASARAGPRSRKGREPANDSHAVAALHVYDALAAACLSADMPLDFVKIDVKGSESRVCAVNSDMRWLRRVGVIFIKTHDDMTTGELPHQHLRNSLKKTRRAARKARRERRRPDCSRAR